MIIPDMKAVRSNCKRKKAVKEERAIFKIYLSINQPTILGITVTTENSQPHTLIYKSLISIPNSSLTGRILYLDFSAGYMNVQM